MRATASMGDATTSAWQTQVAPGAPGLRDDSPWRKWENLDRRRRPGQPADEPPGGGIGADHCDALGRRVESRIGSPPRGIDSPRKLIAAR